MNKKFLLIIIALLLVLSGCSNQNLSLSLGEGIEDLEIINEKTNFEVGEPIYYFLESNKEFDTYNIEVVLYLKDTSGGFAIADRITMDIDREWNMFYNNNPIFLEPGEYKLQTRIDNETSISKEFIVH